MPSVTNLAKLAADKAQARIHACIDAGKNFLVEAGAGAGKTYSLVEALKYLLETRGVELVRRHQRIACISYTNVAANEIESRADRHPAIQSSTIHAFCWSMIKDFQPFLRKELPNLLSWPEKLEESGGVGGRAIDYNLGYPKVEEKTVLLRHSDVLTLTAKLLAQPKFCQVLTSRFPVLFIDEYQDTDKDFAAALKAYLLSSDKGPLIGFFGDHWQKIYGAGCGKIEHPNLEVIGKNANFRSVPVIVDCLNRMRPKLTQEVEDPNAEGSVVVYHSNDWRGARLVGQHFGGDLPPEVAHRYLDSLRRLLGEQGWDLSPEITKILMLTHRVLAAEQGYESFEKIFDYNEAFIKKEDPYIAFFCDMLEPICTAYGRKRFGEMFAVLGDRTPAVRSHADKAKWANDMDKLLRLRESGTIGEVLDHLKQTQRPRPTDAIENRERELERTGQDLNAEEPSSITRSRELRKVPYKELIALNRFIEEETPFSTKHGVKGAEFENVIVVFGRGWNQYNFNQFLEWSRDVDSVPSNKVDSYERNRNLFYVTCSRPRKRLAVLFTQEMTAEAISTLSSWFGGTVVRPLAVSG